MSLILSDESIKQQLLQETSAQAALREGYLLGLALKAGEWQETLRQHQEAVYLDIRTAYLNIVIHQQEYLKSYAAANEGGRPAHGCALGEAFQPLDAGDRAAVLADLEAWSTYCLEVDLAALEREADFRRQAYNNKKSELDGLVSEIQERLRDEIRAWQDQEPPFPIQKKKAHGLRALFTRQESAAEIAAYNRAANTHRIWQNEMDALQRDMQGAKDTVHAAHPELVENIALLEAEWEEARAATQRLVRVQQNVSAFIKRLHRNFAPVIPSIAACHATDHVIEEIQNTIAGWRAKTAEIAEELSAQAEQNPRVFHQQRDYKASFKDVDEAIEAEKHKLDIAYGALLWELFTVTDGLSVSISPSVNAEFQNANGYSIPWDVAKEARYAYIDHTYNDASEWYWVRVPKGEDPVNYDTPELGKRDPLWRYIYSHRKDFSKSKTRKANIGDIVLEITYPAPEPQNIAQRVIREHGDVQGLREAVFGSPIANLEALRAQVAAVEQELAASMAAGEEVAAAEHPQKRQARRR